MSLDFIHLILQMDIGFLALNVISHIEIETIAKLIDPCDPLVVIISSITTQIDSTI